MGHCTIVADILHGIFVTTIVMIHVACCMGGLSTPSQKYPLHRICHAELKCKSKVLHLNVIGIVSKMQCI